MLKLKCQYFGHLRQRADPLEKTLMLGKLKAGGEGDGKGWDGWMASPTQWRWVCDSLGVCDGQGGLACCYSWGRQELDTTERLSWTELNGGGGSGWSLCVPEEVKCLFGTRGRIYTLEQGHFSSVWPRPVAGKQQGLLSASSLLEGGASGWALVLWKSFKRFWKPLNILRICHHYYHLLSGFWLLISFVDCRGNLAQGQAWRGIGMGEEGQ